jgi:glycosidase
MQWDDSKHAGFTSGDKPWMNVHDDYKEWNVANQVDDPSSVISFLRKMIKLRVDHPVLVGDYNA